MQTRVIHRVAEFEQLRDVWLSLLEQNHVRSGVLTWEWAFSWWSVFGADKELWLFTVWDAEALLGLAPLMLEKRRRAGVTLRVLTTLGTPMNDVGGFLIQGENELIVRAIVEAVWEKRQAWDLLEVTEFLAEGIETAALKAFFANEKFHIIENRNEHYYLSLHEEWSQFYGGLSRKFRENLRRAERNAEKRGKVRLEKYTGERLNWKIFEEVISVNRHAYYPSLCDSEKEQAFLKTLLAQADPRLIVYILYFDSKAVGYRYGFLYNNKFEDWRTGFDTRFPSSVSVGKLAASKIIQDAFESGLSEVDFMRGAHAYKRKWKPSSRFFTRIRFFQERSLRARIAYFWLNTLKPLLGSEREGEK